MTHWYAVYTKANHEKKASLILRARDFETFLPTYRVLSRRVDRRKILERPLFPGYLFVHTSPHRFSWITSSPGVVYILGRNGIPTPIPDEEIESIRIIQQEGVDREPAPYCKEGDRVMIIKGPLCGVVGYIRERNGKSNKLVISVDLIYKGVSIKVEEEEVEKF